MNSSPTILALVTEAFGGRGGIAQYNRDLLEALAGSGTESVTVLARYAPDPALPRCGNIRQLPPHASKIGFARAALWLVLTSRFDVVFCGHLFMAPLAALVAKLKRGKLVVQMHGIEAWQPPSRLERAGIEAADRILCVSRHTRSSTLAWASIAPERAIVLPNTVAEDFSPGDEKGLRESWGLAGKRVLLTVGRMDSRERYKGHDRVIAIMPELLARGHDIAYVIVGEGDDRKRIAELAAQKRVAERVLFLGPVSSDVLKRTYRIADLYVMPSTGEGFGIAFLEAMASGVPALGLNAAGAIDALGEGRLGICVDESDLLQSVDQMLSQPKPDPNALAAAVQAEFGREVFNARARAMLESLI